MSQADFIRLDLKASSGNKKRLCVALSWDDLPISGPVKLKEVKIPSWIPGKSLRNFLRHMTIWLKEIAYAGVYARWYYRLSRSSKTKDVPGRDTGFNQRDLDLVCFIFDKNKQFIRMIGPDADHQIDEGRVIYHSGEEYTGMGVGDDESITIEASANVPDEYAHFVFLVLSDSKLTLGQSGVFSLDVKDNVSEQKFITEHINPAHSGNHTAYAFCHISRAGHEWRAKPLNAFGMFETEWETSLQKYL